MEDIKLFISHSSKDQEIVRKIIYILEIGLTVPKGAIRCTSVPGYHLELGAHPEKVLREDILGSDLIIGIITNNSLQSEWVLFELGAAWGAGKEVIVLLDDGLNNEKIPAALKQSVGGNISNPTNLRSLLNQVKEKFNWPSRNDSAAQDNIDQLVSFAKKRSNRENSSDCLENELKSSFTKKLANIGDKQTIIVNFIRNNVKKGDFIPQVELQSKLSSIRTDIFFRLEQLRLLGFLSRKEIGKIGHHPDYAWSLSDSYIKEIEG